MSGPPTLVNMDQPFCNVDWELCFPTAKLLPQSTTISVRCSLRVNDNVKTYHQSRFEAYRQFIEGFHEVVSAAWYYGTGIDVLWLPSESLLLRVIWFFSKDWCYMLWCNYLVVIKQRELIQMIMNLTTRSYSNCPQEWFSPHKKPNQLIRSSIKDCALVAPFYFHHPFNSCDHSINQANNCHFF